MHVMSFEVHYLHHCTSSVSLYHLNVTIIFLENCIKPQNASFHSSEHLRGMKCLTVSWLLVVNAQLKWQLACIKTNALLLVNHYASCMRIRLCWNILYHKVLGDIRSWGHLSPQNNFASAQLTARQSFALSQPCNRTDDNLQPAS